MIVIISPPSGIEYDNHIQTTKNSEVDEGFIDLPSFGFDAAQFRKIETDTDTISDFTTEFMRKQCELEE